MNSNETRTVFPQSLDYNEWLAFGLKSDDALQRLLSLNELTFAGMDKGLRPLVEKISQNDPEGQCRDLASELLVLAQTELQLVSLRAHFDLTPEGMKNLLEDAPQSFVSALKSSLRKPPPPELLDIWREHILGETSAGIVEIGLTLLAKFGRQSDADLAVSFMISPDGNIIKAAMDVMANQNIEGAAGHLVKALSSDSVDVALHAVNLLKNVDLHASLACIDRHLKHSNPLTRLKALKKLLLISFEKAESIYLRFLSSETQPLLLVTAGYGVILNPCSHLPLRIYDIFALSRGIKRHIMQLLVKRTVESIRDAGILSQPIESYLHELKTMIEGRRSAMIMYQALQELSNPDCDARASAVEKLKKFIIDEKVRKALQNQLQDEPNDEIRQNIQSILKNEPEPYADMVEQTILSGAFATLDLSEQKELLRSIRDPAVFRKLKNSLNQLLQTGSSRQIILETLSVFNNHGSKADVHILTPLLQHPEKSVTAAAIRLLGKLDIDAILPQLNKLLADDDPRIKSAALEVFMVADKEGAVNYLEAMSRTHQVSLRRMALSLMPLLDYASAYPLLRNCLFNDHDAALRNQAGYMIAANPTKEGLYALFCASHEKSGELKNEFADLWSLAVETGAGVFHETPREIEEECKVMSADSIPDLQSDIAVSAQSAAETHASPEHGKRTPGADILLGRLLKSVADMKLQIAIAIIIVSPLLWFLAGQIFDSNETGKNSFDRSAVPDRVFSAAYDKTGLTTQVGGPDWDGILFSRVPEILSSSAYSRLIDQAELERSQSKESIEEKYLDYLKQLSASEDQDAMIRMIAGAHINPDLREGQAALRKGDSFKAVEAMTRVLNDTSSNPVARVLALQALMEIAIERGSEDEFMHWLSELVTGACELPDMNKVKEIKGFKDFQNTFRKIIQISNMTQDPEYAENMQRAFSDAGCGGEETEEKMTALSETSAAYERLFDRR